jgi:hypothetical protein
MRHALDELEVEIRNFLGDTSQARETFGVMTDVKVTFIGLREALAEIAGAWGPAARAAVAELDRLLGPTATRWRHCVRSQQA